LGDDAHKIVQTFPKQGYRLNAATPTERSTTWSAIRPLYAAGVVVVILITSAVTLIRTLPEETAGLEIEPAMVAAPAEHLREAVAILPFAAEPDSNRFLASGLSDDLEIRLAEMSAIKLVSHRQVAAVIEVPQTPVALAKLLDARYLVDGDLREYDGVIAFSFRLIDGADGTTLWADRFEGTRAEFMAFRATMPETLVNAMSIELSARDRRRLALRDTVDPVAFEEVAHARRELSTFTYQGNLAAERHLRRAIAHDPDYARAYAELASTFVIRMENNWIILSSADEDKAFYFAHEALRLDEGLWFAHYALGRLHSIAPSGDTASALEHLHRAMSLLPANDDPRAYFAIVTALSGNLEEGAEILESVMATHPEPPFWYYLGLANIRFHQRQYAKAAETVTGCLMQMPNSPYCLRTQIAVMARLGQIDDAAWAVEEYAILGHEVSLQSMMNSALERDPDLRSHLENSYRLAGVE
jgi:TolB-like protein